MSTIRKTGIKYWIVYKLARLSTKLDRRWDVGMWQRGGRP